MPIWTLDSGLELSPLEESAALLKLTLRAAQAGSWAWDVMTGETFWSEEFHLLMGTTPATCKPSTESWLQTIHPEDRVGALVEMERALAGSGELHNEFRIVRPDGTVRSIRSRGRILRNREGKPLRMVGVCFDITEARRIGTALRASDERFRTAVETLMDCLGIYEAVRDEEGRIVDFRVEYVNEAACRANRMTRQEQIGRMLCEILPAHRENGLFEEYCQVVETGQPLVRDTLVYEDEYPSQRLKRSFDLRVVRLGDGFLATWRDITPRKRIEEELQKSDRRKDEFLAVLAHELRNPLAPIRNAVEVMRQLGSPDPRVRQMQDVVDRQTDQLARMVDDLLDVSRIREGKIELRRERADLLTIIGRAVETSRPLIDEGEHRLTLSLPTESLQVEGDIPRLTQALSNLLSNAAKYTEKGGDLQLAAEALDGKVSIRVKDDGMGIPADLLPRVFDLFTQADRTLGRAKGGLGIGLALVKNIVEMHGGTVRAASAGPGQGSEFVVELPLRGEPAPEEAPTAGRPDAEGMETLSRRILVVDDNLDTADSLALLLELGGHEVRTTHDGVRALEVAQAFQPDVVLLDIGLPRMDGYEVAERLRLHPETRRSLLIAISGYGQDEDRQRAFAAGFDHHLIKPVDYETLKALIVRRPPPRGSDPLP